MTKSLHGGEGRRFHAVSIRKIENGWVSSTTHGDAHGVRSVERFHAKKPELGGAGLRAARPAPAKTAGRLAGGAAGDAYRDPAQRPKPAR